MFKLWHNFALALATAALALSVPVVAQSSQTATAKPATSKSRKTAKASGHKASSTSRHSSATQSSKARVATARKGSKRGKNSKTSWRRGQQKVDSERTRQIQEALIREHYLNGTASGKWDAGTEDALRRLQADNGWQNKTVPDSRALIKLGLGPSHDHLLNPESAMTTTPEPPRATGITAGPSEPSEPSNQPQR